MRRVDVNCDLGESFGAYTIGQDEKILDQVTSANVACGFHAGDHNVMAKTVKMAAAKGVKIGAHPGFPDLLGFGRRLIETNPEDIYNFVVYQISALKGFCDIEGVRMQHVKPHGALFNLAATDGAVAEAIAKAVYDVDRNLVLFGLSCSELIKAGTNIGLRVANEVFADRTYQANGTLTPRTHEHALIHDVRLAIEQVVMMIKSGKVRAVDGTIVPIQADTICVHGDGEKALEFTQELRRALQVEGISIRSIL
ncbi:LamB/YcsF family protein [Halalkalibacter alkaliphilus]|uniref:5-oxoprolinase subunit A n=1 Tax=Halalkalibacter alkaliphilus TaxID=2917993 RepID=A0A9X2CWN7_9BACI|nr:5-oxoprolinase subunit PxpA [Halalkalibacter alkaliphilus]MCL7749653.1 LamB/YcsF family protein [Halalkalibacter alkaliphilus]